MSVEEEITQKASALYAEYRGGDHLLETLDDALEAVSEAGDIDAIALAYLLGLLACRVWYIDTRPEMRMAQERLEFTKPGKNKTNEAHAAAKVRVSELSELTRDEMENRLTLGYMALYGDDHVTRSQVSPVANCIAEIFQLESAEGRWEGMEDNVYTNLHGRCSRYIDAKGADAFSDSEEFLKSIITTLFVQSSPDI